MEQEGRFIPAGEKERLRELQMPLVINLSFGNSYGAHDGSSLLERFLDNA